MEGSRRGLFQVGPSSNCRAGGEVDSYYLAALARFSRPRHSERTPFPKSGKSWTLGKDDSVEPKGKTTGNYNTKNKTPEKMTALNRK